MKLDITTIHHCSQIIPLTSELNIELLAINHYKGSVRRNFPYHMHDYYELSFTFAGDTWVTLNGQKNPLKDGTICLIAPNTIHEIALPDRKLFSIEQKNDDIWELNFRLISKQEEQEPHLIITDMEQYQDFFHASLPLLQQFLLEHDTLETPYTQLVQSLIGFVLERIQNAPISIMDSSDERIREILLYLYNHFQENPSIDFLCHRFAISRSLMMKKFREQYQISPANYRIDRQMSTACDLLYDSDLPLREVAERTGFDDVSYFSSSFSKRLQMSPQQFREQCRLHREKKSL